MQMTHCDDIIITEKKSLIDQVIMLESGRLCGTLLKFGAQTPPTRFVVASMNSRICPLFTPAPNFNELLLHLFPVHSMRFRWKKENLQL